MDSTTSLGMSVVTCCKCGLPFNVPDEWLAARRANHDAFYCPNGHTQYFQDKSQEDILREKLDKANKDLTIKTQCCESKGKAIQHLKAKCNGMKGAYVKLKKQL